MTRYTVVWLKSVQNDVTTIWLESSDRNAITAACTEIDLELATDADAKGNELSEGLRVFDSGPLRAVYSINAEDRLVEVCRIRLR